MILYCGLMTTVLHTPSPVSGQATYQRPPPEVLQILHAPVTPEVSLSPARDFFLLVERDRYPDIDELSRPMLGLAGVRINPNNNGPQRTPLNKGLVLQALQGGETRRITLPPGSRFATPVWSPDGKRLAFAMFHPDRVELWVADVATAKTRLVKGLALNATLGAGFQWMPDSRHLLCRAVVEKRGPAPAAPSAPSGPNIQESYGKAAPARTHQDLLKTPHDDELLEY
jgi:dipeptidyl aminopeptidase/acylaminoacyl peptidase